MSYTITERTMEAQPILVGRRTVTRSEIAAAIGEVFGLIMAYTQRHPVQMAGPPLTRYPEMAMDKITLEPGMPIASAAGLPNEDGVTVDSLRAGPAAVTLHAGPYDKLGEAYAALQEWMKENGTHPAGPPWEVYLTDPQANPDPATWKTEIYWPIAR